MQTMTTTARHQLPMRHVSIADGFWAPRREIVRKYTLKQQEHQLRHGGQFDALKLQWRPGDANEPHIFWESDVAKWIEAASYVLARQPDDELAQAVDEAIGLLANAQQDDGYLNVYFTVVRPGERFTDLRDAHELYCAGHLIEAGVAHFQATGKRTLLDIVQRYADLIDREFGPGGAAEGGYDGHEEIELALVKLYRATGERRYLDLSKRLIDARGTQPFYFDREVERRGTEGYFAHVFPHRPNDVDRFREYNQSHLPVVEQSDAVGHSVRAMYLYAAMADLADELDDDDLRTACERLWTSVTKRKMYVTGGIGSDHSIEGFGPDYDLPDATGYAETCAAIGLVLWAQRMTNLTGEARFADVMERALYNGVLSGASANGTHYFYGNPLASAGSVHRHEWFGVACCPPNFARVLSSLEYYVWAEGPEEAIVNLFVASSASFTFHGRRVTVTQDTQYPTDGDIRISVATDAAAEFRLLVRIPAWADEVRLEVNGEVRLLDECVHDGYAVLDRQWENGDEVRLLLPMTPQRVWAHPAVAASAGKVTLMRGPVVYCAEGVDHPVATAALSIPRRSPVLTGASLAGDLPSLLVDGLADRSANGDDALYTSAAPEATPTLLTAVPYFAWANRGESTMSVWIREATNTSD